MKILGKEWRRCKKNIYKRPRRTKNTQTKLNNTLERISRGMTEANEWISGIEDRMMEITATEQDIEKRRKRNEGSLRDL